MSNWNLVWLHPKPSPRPQYYDGSPPKGTFLTQLPQGPPLTVEKEQQMVKNLQRDTKSSAAKRDPAMIKRLNLSTFSEMDSQVSWSKMNYFQDVMNCMWSKDGSKKRSTKI